MWAIQPEGNTILCQIAIISCSNLLAFGSVLGCFNPCFKMQFLSSAGSFFLKKQCFKATSKLSLVTAWIAAQCKRTTIFDCSGSRILSDASATKSIRPHDTLLRAFSSTHLQQPWPSGFSGRERLVDLRQRLLASDSEPEPEHKSFCGCRQSAAGAGVALLSLWREENAEHQSSLFPAQVR